MVNMPNRREVKCSTMCAGIFFVLAVAVVICGIVSAITKYPQKIVDSEFQRHLITSLDSPTFSDWLNPPPPIYMKYYIFNVTNGYDVIKGEKPELEEHGPYTYRMYVPRFDVSFYTNDTVSYKFNRTLVFQPDLSSGAEDDLLFHINMPLVTVAAMMETMSLPDKAIETFAKLVELVGERDLVSGHTAKEILFGYEDPFFEMLNDILSIFGLHYDPVFAPFHNFNNSDDGLYLAKTGRNDYPNTNKIERWSGEQLLPYWTTDEANMLNGTDGSFFRPYVTKTEPRYIFFTGMCRSLKLVYESDSSVKGVDTLRFHFADDLLANATVQPANAGFCVPSDNCYDSGVMNASPCRQGAPVLLSLPHFYNAAPSFQKGVKGLKPNKSLHDSVYDVESTSGVVFFSRRSVQINIEVNTSRYINQMKDLSYFVCPALWLGGVAEMDDDTAAEFRGVMALVKFTNILSYLMIGLGVLTILVILFINYRRRRRFRGELLLNDKPDDGTEIDSH